MKSAAIARHVRLTRGRQKRSKRRSTRRREVRMKRRRKSDIYTFFTKTAATLYTGFFSKIDPNKAKKNIRIQKQ